MIQAKREKANLDRSPSIAGSVAEWQGNRFLIDSPGRRDKLNPGVSSTLTASDVKDQTRTRYVPWKVRRLADLRSLTWYWPKVNANLG